MKMSGSGGIALRIFNDQSHLLTGKARVLYQKSSCGICGSEVHDTQPLRPVKQLVSRVWILLGSRK